VIGKAGLLPSLGTGTNPLSESIGRVITMQFEIEHRFDATPDQLLEVSLHPRLSEVLVPEMENLVEMELLSDERSEGSCSRQVRYRPEPIIRKIGPKKVEPRWMEFVEHSNANLTERRIEYKNIPRVDTVAKILENSGTIEVSRTPSGCVRRVSGVLKIKFPLLGRLVEKTIYKQAQRLLDEEAAVTAKVLAAGGVEAFLGE